MQHDDDLDRFTRLIAALTPFLGELVIIGGWAHRLYRFHSDASIPPYSPLFTEDADIAIPADAKLSESVLERLHAYGFIEEFLGDDHPPVTHYRLGEKDSGFYAEFLTPLVGGGGRPGRRSQDTEEIAGVIAQKLRYLDILTIDPWRIALGKRTVRVPNAVCFIAQKLLIHAKRRPTDRAKDVLYLHDTIELFGPSLDELRQLWLHAIETELQDSIADNVEHLAGELCREVTDAIRGAAREALSVGRALTPEAIQVVCEEGLSRIFQR